MLTLEGGRALSDGQVQAIIHLVASSVPGLSPDGVSVVDQNGRLLSGGGGAAAGATGESERQIAVQQAVEDRYRQAISTLLTPIVGAGNFTAEVHADMDFSQVEASREAYPEASRTLRTEQGSVSSETGGGGQTVGGIPGTLANEAPPPATTVPATDPNAAPVPGVVPGTQETRRNEQYARNYAVGREVSVTRNQTGTVKRLSVAVALRNVEGGKVLTRDELQAMENLVRGAVGFTQDRGDVVAITARSFAVEEPPVTSWWESAWLSPLVRSGVGLIVALAVVFGIGRPMLKKLSAAAKAKSERSDEVGKQIAAALADQSKNIDTVTIDMIEAAPSYEARAALIRSFVRQDPARAALVVRDLIRADTKGSSNG
jgi:flagellar M-ring protein FliF